jgi:VWFA-related protein
MALVPTLLAYGQQPAAAPQQQPQVQSQVQPATSTTTFTASAHLVLEEVSVKDKNGRTIEGLKQEDFAVTEDNKPQTIKFFDYEKLDDIADAVPTFQDRTTAAPPVAALTRTQIAPEPAGEVHYKDRRLLALYFDMQSMAVEDQIHALDAAQKFIRSQMSPVDLVAIMQYNGTGVEVLQDFIGDKEKLLSTIATMALGEADTSGETNADASAADNGAAFGQDDSEFNIFNTDRQLAALQSAAKMLGTLNEKKSLVYFASGMQLNGLDNQAQLSATINDAIRAGVAFWPIDARGLVANPPLGSATRGSQGNQGMYTGAAAMAVQQNFSKSQDTLYTLASDTGGKALLDYNDLGQGIVNAEKSISSYYIIGYYTTNDKLDGKFRRVNITLTKPGVQANLDFRKGYFAGKEFSKFTATDKERQLEDALMMGDPITELTIMMEVNYFRLDNANYFVPIMVKIPGSELALARKGGAEHTLIDFIGEIKDEQGNTEQNMRDHMDIKLSDATAAEWAKRPIEYDTGYTLFPGLHKIKVLARDAETGRIGTYMGSFYIPNLTKEDQHVPITSVVLSSQRAAMKEALATAGNANKAAITQAANPLVQDGQKLIPSVTRVFSSKSEMYVYLQAYQKGATTANPLVAYVSFFQGPAKVMETPPVKVTEGLDPKSHMLPVKISFPLGKLKPGEYMCELTVLDPTSQKSAFWQAPVMVIP